VPVTLNRLTETGTLGCSPRLIDFKKIKKNLASTIEPVAEPNRARCQEHQIRRGRARCRRPRVWISPASTSSRRQSSGPARSNPSAAVAQGPDPVEQDQPVLHRHRAPPGGAVLLPQVLDHDARHGSPSRGSWTRSA
jgi:hypothetical protein